MSPLSLAQQIAELDDAAPADVDLERLDGGLGEEEGNEDLAAGRGHYMDVGTSSLRKQRDALVDPKYDGVRTSRNQLYEFDDGSDEENVNGLDEGSSASEPESDVETGDEENDDTSQASTLSPDEDDDGGDGAEEHDSRPADDAIEDPPADTLTATLKKTREADKDKGRAIIKQRALWDSLLETRIRLQKAATASNRLPHPDHLAPYVTSEAGQEAAEALVREVLAFSEDLLTLRKRLIETNEPEVEVPPSKRRKTDEANWEEQTRDSTLSSTELDASYHPSCVRTLHKWSSKIAAVTPSALSSRNAKSFRGGAAATRSVVELVEDALGESGVSGSGKAVGRTRVRRSASMTIGVHPGEEKGAQEKNGEGVEGDAEVFDDLDFYQILLRDVIDSRTGADGAKDWTARQRLKKAKKVVDTKASKGRKLRYEAHEKLQNFMVPVPAAGWHEEQIDELFANLLGRDISSKRQPETALV